MPGRDEAAATSTSASASTPWARHQRHGPARRAPAVRRHLPRLLRLHAPRGAPGRADELPVIYVWTHDSVGLGEDGPTHQPIEHLAALRAIPGLLVIRPADANETVEAWRAAIAATTARPRWSCPARTCPRSTGPPRRGRGPARGAYVLADAEAAQPRLILIATGSEVSLALAARDQLQADGDPARVVSMPCWELFEDQDQAYRDEVLPPGVTARWRSRPAHRSAGTAGSATGARSSASSSSAPPRPARW